MILEKWDGERLRTRLCAFFLPCILMLTVFAAIGIYPFGDKSLLIIDMNSEYVDYLAQMNESVRTGGSLLRSWNMGMGLNMLGLIAFYTSSAFNLLVLLFPVACITEVLFAVTLLKIGLAGLLFSIYTEYVFERKGVFAVLFSVAYALCAYNIAYASNIMWLDGAAFLPLVLLGVEKLLRENRCGVLLLSLTYVFFSSYYIGYMLGVFAFLYLTAQWFSQPRARREYPQKLIRLIATAAVAAGCCAFLLLPAFLNLRSGQTEMFLLDLSPELQRPFVRILSRMLPGVYDTLTDSGYPNIFTSMLGLLLCVVYFVHKWIPRRHKLVFGGLLGFVLLSFSCRFIYLAWHAFEDPTWFPARYSFVFCFLVLFLAMHAAAKMESLPLSGMLGAVAVVLVLVVEIGNGRYRYVEMKNLVTGGILVLLYLGIWLLWRRKQSRWLAPVALVVLCVEVWGNAVAMEWRLDDQFHYRTRESYTAFREQYGPVVEEVARQNECGAYRLEIVEQRNANGGMALGYNGISHYSTTTNQALNALLRRLGYNRGTENELRFARSTPLTNGLLGIRYVLSQEELGGGYTKRYTEGDVSVYENRCAFPLAFWAPAEAMEFTGESDNPFALQNEWMKALGAGDSFFTPIADVQYTLQNLDREQHDGYLLYSPRVQHEDAHVQYTLHNPNGWETYAYFPVWQRRFSKADLVLEGKLLQQDLRYRKNAIAPLGNAEDISLTMNLAQNTARIEDEYFYQLDVDAAEAAAATAWESAMEFEQFSDTAVSGKVTAPRDGVLVTTIPFDSGWSISIDGSRVQPQAFAGIFLALPLTEGEHAVAMRYWPPGFVPGCWISAGCVGGVVGFVVYRRRKKRQQI